jgi:stage II sporulation protein D
MVLKLFALALLDQLKRSPRSLWLAAFIWVCMLAPAQAALELRVAIKNKVSEVKVGSSTTAVVKDAAGRPLGEIQGMNAFVAEQRGNSVALDQWQSGLIWIEPSNGGFAWIGDRWYRGRTLVVPTKDGLTAVNYVDLEHYLYSVLGGEMNGNWPQEALKAQAVAARSYALYQRKSGNNIFDVGDTAAWQVYRGVQDESPGTQAAVEATKSQVLICNKKLPCRGQIIEAVFHSASGGHTEDVENVWLQPLPYLRGVPDFDQKAPVYEWSKSFTGSQMSSLISGVGKVLCMEPEAPPRPMKTGRVKKMKVVGEGGTKTVTGDDLREALGLRSTLFAIGPDCSQISLKSGPKPTPPTTFTVNGRGFGHGLGMSQWGAYQMALEKKNYQQIVLHYYTDTELAKIDVVQ